VERNAAPGLPAPSQAPEMPGPDVDAVGTAARQGGGKLADAWLSTAVEEYKALRAEVTTSITAQVSILSFGSATLALVIGPTLTLWHRSALATGLVFSVLVPVLSAMVVVIWFGEVLRMVRAGSALADLEDEINTFGQEWNGWPIGALSWEYALRTKERASVALTTFVINVRGVFGVFTLLALVSLAIACIRDYEEDDAIGMFTVLGCLMSVVFGLLVALYLKWRWRDEKEGWEARTKSREERRLVLKSSASGNG
jgi:hypothetical protein